MNQAAKKTFPMQLDTLTSPVSATAALACASNIFFAVSDKHLVANPLSGSDGDTVIVSAVDSPRRPSSSRWKHIPMFGKQHLAFSNWLLFPCSAAPCWRLASLLRSDVPLFRNAADFLFRVFMWKHRLSPSLVTDGENTLGKAAIPQEAEDE